MEIKVEEVNVDLYLENFVAILNRNREKKVGKERFKWLYLDNPAGKARAWVVYDCEKEDNIAFTSVIPRIVSVDGKNFICWNCCDFSVDKNYRSLGVALKLRRKATECIDNGEIRALYAHPNNRMKIVHERVGHSCIGEMQRYAKVLQTQNYIKRAIKNQRISSLIGYAVNLTLSFWERRIVTDRSYSYHQVDDPIYSKEYDEFYNEIADYYRVLGDRTASYLNWRYGKNPLYSSKRLILKDGRKLVGYLIYYIENGVAIFKDILCLPDKNTVYSLIGYWLNILRKKDVTTVSLSILNTNPLIPFFKKLGFRIRPDRSYVYVYANEEDDICNIWMHGRNWYMTVGDRDV